MMMSRPILKKQTSYRLYRPSSIAIAGTLADLPFSMPKMLMFNIIVYFMTNLHRSAGGFFTYHLFVSVCAFALQGLFRTLGHLCQTPDQAIRLATIAVPSLYVPPPPFLPPLFRCKVADGKTVRSILGI